MKVPLLIRVVQIYGQNWAKLYFLIAAEQKDMHYGPVAFVIMTAIIYWKRSARKWFKANLVLLKGTEKRMHTYFIVDSCLQTFGWIPIR
jgi:hypothetical protein